MAKTKPYLWTAKIKRESLSKIQRLAGDLGYLVDNPGAYNGQPSAPQLIDALANAYEANPENVVDGLRRIGLGISKNN